MAKNQRSTKRHQGPPSAADLKQWREWAETANFRLTSAQAILHLIDPGAPNQQRSAMLQDAIFGVDALLARHLRQRINSTAHCTPPSRAGALNNDER